MTRLWPWYISYWTNYCKYWDLTLTYQSTDTQGTGLCYRELCNCTLIGQQICYLDLSNSFPDSVCTTDKSRKIWLRQQTREWMGLRKFNKTKLTFSALPQWTFMNSQLHFQRKVTNHIFITNIDEERVRFWVSRMNSLAVVLSRTRSREASFGSREGRLLQRFPEATEHPRSHTRQPCAVLRLRSSNNGCGCLPEWEAASVNFRGDADEGRCVFQKLSGHMMPCTQTR